MAKSEVKEIPDSHIVYGKKRQHDIRGYAETKFGSSFIHVKVNRAEERFDVIVNSSVKDSDKKEFEQLWTMCKVLTVIE